MIQFGVPEQCLNSFQRLSLREQPVRKCSPARMTAESASQSSIAVQHGYMGLEAVSGPIVDPLASIVDAPLQAQLLPCAFVSQYQFVRWHKATIRKAVEGRAEFPPHTVGKVSFHCSAGLVVCEVDGPLATTFRYRGLRLTSAGIVPDCVSTSAISIRAISVMRIPHVMPSRSTSVSRSALRVTACRFGDAQQMPYLRRS